MRKIHQERLRKLYAIIDGIPEDAFNLDLWVKKWPGREIGEAPRASCGTIACALGWAALHPEFQAEGLQVSTCSLSRSPVFDGNTGYRAGAEFFGLSSSEAAYLFEPNNTSCRDKAVFLRRLADLMLGHQVISRVRRDELVADLKPQP